MTDQNFDLWVYLSSSPLLWLTATVAAYFIADRIAQFFGRTPLLHPMILTVACLGSLLIWTRTPYETYFEGAQFVHFMLGPATVALGIPLYENRHIIRRALLPTIAALLVGCVVATFSAVAIAMALGAPKELLISIAPKSITTPVAMGISQALGGDPTLTVAIVMVTAISGILFISPLMNVLRIHDQRARGLATGITCHGLGTAHSLSESALAGSFSGIGMGMSSLITAVFVPLLLKAMGII